MLQTLSSSPYAFLPPIPSPLSPRRESESFSPSYAHAHASAYALMQASNNSSTPTVSPTTTPSRTPRSNPRTAARATTNPSTLSLKRRQLFLQKVANNRDDARYAARADDWMRLDHVAEVRRWREELARSAPASVLGEESDGDMDTGMDGGLTGVGEEVEAEIEAERLAEAERSEVEALVAMMEREEQEQQRQGQGEERRPDGGMDEDEDEDDVYDSIFAEFVESAAGRGPGGFAAQGQPQDGDASRDVEMDMS